jgi:2-hydroxychromene-2-carboxylate isomerase
VSLTIAEDQPLARRLGRLGIAATERGRGLEFCRQISQLLWSGDVTGWDQGDFLAKATIRAGLDLSDLEAAIVADPNRFEAQLDENDLNLRAAGHWGVPTVVFEGEPFFGQDRFDVLVWRMKQNGLKISRQ